jgi:diguanylate cyclase (GGDEF)-like protein
VDSSWRRTFRELRGQFAEGAGERLAAIDGALDRLLAKPEDRESLAEVRLRFHGLSGTGATFGFPRVSVLGMQGEHACDAVAEAGRTPTPDEIGTWRELVEEVREAFRADAAIAGGEPAGTAVPAKAATPPGSARSIEILVAHDDAELRAALASQLDREGMTVTVASDLADARTILAQRVPDVLVVDMLFGGGQGGALVERLRGMPGGEGPAAFIVGAPAGFVDKVEAIRCGADAYFEQPVDWDLFTRRLRQVLDRSRSEAPRILSVEDDPDHAAFVKAVLESAGYEVRICADPARFEAEAIGFTPDLVLMDINLPGFSGYDLARFLKQNEKYAAVPVVFLTAENRAQSRIDTIRAGGDDYLVKPVAPALLLSTVAARIERAQFLKSLLGRDGLTGLLNHTAFFEGVRGALLRQARAPGKGASFILIDLDHFKAVNDRHGHPVGDRVLAALGALLRRRLRGSDLVGRLGGEEFAAILEDLTEEEAERLMNRLLEEFSVMPHTGADRSVFQVTFSVGVAGFVKGMTMDAWRQAADDALYAAKSAGRRHVVRATRPEVAP